MTARARRKLPEEQGGGDLARFRHQDVVGAAGRLDVHDLESDARAGERRGEPRMREALPWPGAEDDDFHAKALQRLEIFARQAVECGNLPALHLLRGDDEARGVAL